MSKAELFRRMCKSKFFVTGSIMVIIVIVLALFAPYIAPYNPEAISIQNRLQPPEWFSKGSEGHVLGTNALGQDILSKLLVGSRISLLVAVMGVMIPSIFGTTLGVIAGYYGKGIDMLITRLADIQQSIPQLILAITVMAILGSSVFNLLIVISLTGWVIYTRITRSTVLSLRESEFVKAERVLGASDKRIMFTQILPNTLTPLIIAVSQQIGAVILVEASLSYLGMGIPMSIPSWGAMIAEGRDYIATSPWIVLVPGIALMFTVLSFNFLGDGIRDVLDPKSKD